MKALRYLVLCFVTALLLCAAGAAQTTTSGDITGTITDPSGAVIPNTTVTLTNDATGQTVNVTTNNAGYFRASSLNPGNYTLDVKASGFAEVKKRVVVAVGQITPANIALATTAGTTTVEVTDVAPVVQSENGDVASTHDSREIDYLPNGGGDQTYVAQTSPGAVINNAGGYGNFSTFGLPGTSNLFTVNGNDNMDPYLNLNNSGATNLTLGANELSEVSVVNNGYSVQYGRQAGAQVNSTTRSGSNEFHGNAIYYWNGRVMNANNWFNKHVDPASGTPVTPRGFVNANQWSARLGGPIVKDKTFFFVDTEGLRVAIPIANQVFIPSPQFQAFTLANVGAAQVPFYTKLFGLYNTPQAATASAVTAAQDPSGAQGCGDLDGTAGFGTGGTPCALTYHTESPNFAHEWTLAARVDHQLSTNDQLFVRYHMDRGVQPTYTDPLSPVFNTASFQPSYDGQLHETHTFGASAVNQFILSGSYYRAIFVNQTLSQSLAAYPSSTIFLDGLFTGVGGINFDFPQGRNVTQYQVVDDLSKTLGNHTLKVGLNYRRNDITDFSNGVFTIPEQLVFSMTDFASGINDFLRQRFPQRIENPIAIWSAGFYGEDDWRVTNNLKLTLGLRVDHDSNPVCQSNCFSRLPGPYLTTSTDATAPYNSLIKTGLHQAFPKTDNLLWQPRVGFAWQPFGQTSQFVMRGGAGIFYDLLPGTLVDNFINNAPGNIELREQSGTAAFSPGVPGSAYDVLTGSAAAFQQQFANGGNRASIIAAVPAFNGVSFQTTVNDVRTPQFQEWNLEAEQGFGSKTTLSLNYVGNHGIHIPMYNGYLNARCTNAAVCSAINNVIPTASRNTAFTTIRELTSAGVSNYNGLTTSLRHNFSNGFQAQLNYTWSHALDTVSNGGILPWSGTDSLLSQLSPLGPKVLNYGNADYDTRHSITASYIYQLPFKFSNGFVNELLGGWSLGETLFYHTGYPFTVTDTTAFTGSSAVRNSTGVGLPANIVGPVNFQSCVSGPSIDVNAPGCLDPASFASVTDTGIPANFSNQRRNQFVGPRYFNTDLSLRKAIKLSERLRLSLGATAYNVLNHPNFGQPGSALSGALGFIGSTVNPPTSPLGAFLGGDASARTVQLEGRITF